MLCLCGFALYSRWVPLICHVILFKSFIMTENNDGENFFLICSKGRPTFDANFKAIDCCYQVK